MGLLRSRRFPAILFLLAFSVWASGSRALSQTVPAAKTTVIRHVSIVDVRTGRLLPDRIVVIRGERIARIAPEKSSVKTALPHDARIVNGNGLFLLPGLFDAHVHLNNPERDSAMLIANGVTFVRDMGGITAERIAERARARRGDWHGLEMTCVGTILDGDPPYHAWSRACGTPDEGRAAVREMKTAGVDQIKVYSLLQPDVFRAILSEAKKLDLKVVGHVPDSLTLLQATEAGQAEVEHLSRYSTLLSALLPDYHPKPGEFDGGIWSQYPRVPQP